MVKKKSTIQNIIIIILCILLFISIGFGVTYSYYNGKSNLVSGSITTATLSIKLHDKYGQTSNFSITAPYDEKLLVPGNNLNNVELRITNDCDQETYIVVLYKLKAVKDTPDGDGEDVTSTVTNLPAISFKDGAINSAIWHKINYYSAGLDSTFTCLVGINPFKAWEEQQVFDADSLKIPEEWNDDLQGCNITISITAYAIQADGLTDYDDLISESDKTGGTPAKCQAIAKAVLEICKVVPIES